MGGGLAVRDGRVGCLRGDVCVVGSKVVHDGESIQRRVGEVCMYR